MGFWFPVSHSVPHSLHYSHIPYLTNTIFTSSVTNIPHGQLVYADYSRNPSAHRARPFLHPRPEAAARSIYKPISAPDIQTSSIQPRITFPRCGWQIAKENRREHSGCQQKTHGQERGHARAEGPRAPVGGSWKYRSHYKERLLSLARIRALTIDCYMWPAAKIANPLSLSFPQAPAMAQAPPHHFPSPMALWTTITRLLHIYAPNTSGLESHRATPAPPRRRTHLQVDCRAGTSRELELLCRKNHNFFFGTHHNFVIISDEPQICDFFDWSQICYFFADEPR